MDDMDLTLPPGLDSALSDFYTAPQPDPAFAARLELSLRRRHGDLLPPSAVSRERTTFMQTLRARPALVLLFVLLALALLTGAAYAIGRLSGFIPGFGFTSDTGAALTLLEPVEITHEGITLRVLQATSDPQRFSVTIEQIGQVETTSDFVHPFITITLPNGAEVEFQESTGSASGNSDNIIIFHFKPLPPDTREISLRYEIREREKGSLWQAELALRLRPLRADEVIPPPAQGAWQPIASENRGGLRLVLENVATASDKTVLQVALHFDQPGTILNSDWNVTLTGADGTIYPLTQVMNDSENRIKTYETVPFKGGESLTLSLTAFPDPRNLPLSLDLSGDTPAFTFDPGPNPQAGQTWQLDETLSVGSFILKVTSVQLTNPNTLVFTLQSDGSANGVMLYSEKASGSSGSMPTSGNTFSAELTFASLPTEPFEIRLMRVNYTAQGEWNIPWHAPAAPASVQIGGTATPPPTPSVFISPTPAFSDPLWLELVSLTEAFDAPFQQGPGWIRYVTETETYPAPGLTYPPPYIRTEQWLEIDEQGYAIRSVYTDYDQAGNILQRSVTVGDYSINLTLGETGYFGGQRYKFSSSFLRQVFNAAQEYGATVHIEEISCTDGEPCYLITSLDSFSTPFQNPGEPVAFSGSAKQLWVMKDSGKTLKTLSIWRLEDGTERVDRAQTLLTLEKLPAPPREVMEILDKVILP